MYTVEEYIQFIETGRFDKISPDALEQIAKAFRELEQDNFVLKYQNGSGYTER